MGTVDNIEAGIKNRTDAAIQLLLKRHGVTIQIHRIADVASDAYAEVYGTSGNTTTDNLIDTIEVLLITGDEFTPMDLFDVGGFEEAFAIDPSNTVREGDTIEVTRAGDSKKLKFQVMNKETKGRTASMFEKYKLSSIVG